MTLTADERRLLEMTAAATEPVAMSDFFHTIHPPNFETSAAEDNPRREAWTELQLGLYRAMITLHDAELVEVVHPANGERSDMVRVTDAGRVALA